MVSHRNTFKSFRIGYHQTANGRDMHNIIFIPHICAAFWGQWRRAESSTYTYHRLKESLPVSSTNVLGLVCPDEKEFFDVSCSDFVFVAFYFRSFATYTIWYILSHDIKYLNNPNKANTIAMVFDAVVFCFPALLASCPKQWLIILLLSNLQVKGLGLELRIRPHTVSYTLVEKLQDMNPSLAQWLDIDSVW